MIKAVLLDVDNTLLDFDLGAKQAAKEIFDGLGLEYPEDLHTVFTRINNALWQNIEKGILTKEQLYEIRWQLIFDELGVKANGREFESLFRERLKESAIPVDGVLELVKYLSGKYTLCIASNGPYGQQIRRLKKAGLYGYIKHFFVSERIGAPKPGREFFEHCLKELSPIKREEVIMIGDSLTADISGAAAFGMKSCYFTRGQRAEKSPADYTVAELCDIRCFL